MISENRGSIRHRSFQILLEIVENQFFGAQRSGRACELPETPDGGEGDDDGADEGAPEEPEGEQHPPSRGPWGGAGWNSKRAKKQNHATESKQSGKWVAKILG